jgi:hypothetical protein
MTLLGAALIAAGVVLVALGYARARGPWNRYRALKAQDDNAARYRAWRGGPATTGTGGTGASVAMQMLRREARTWAAVAAGGVVLAVGGLLLVGR